MIEFKSASHAQEFTAFESATAETMSLTHWMSHVVLFSTRAGASRRVVDRFDPSMAVWYRMGETVASAVGNVLCAHRACIESGEEQSRAVRDHIRGAIRTCSDVLAKSAP